MESRVVCFMLKFSVMGVDENDGGLYGNRRVFHTFVACILVYGYEN